MILKNIAALFLAENRRQMERRRLLQEYRQKVQALDAHVKKGEQMLNLYRKQIAAEKAKAGIS